MELKQIQKNINNFQNKNNLHSPSEYIILDLLSELGEVSKELLLMSDYGRKKKKFRKEIREEIGDVFYSLINLSNSLEINLEEVLELSLKKYKKRLKYKKNIGSK